MGIRETVEEQWKKINPYYVSVSDYGGLETRKNIIEILNDFYTCTSSISGLFQKPLSAFAFQSILRGRKGIWKEKSQLSPPSIEEAKKHNIVNRWNPPDKRFLYLSVGDPDNAIETIKAELRTKHGEELTIGEFIVGSKTENTIIADLDYDRISHNEIFSELEVFEKKEAVDIFSNFLNNRVIPTEAKIKDEIEKRHNEMMNAIVAFCGKLMLKEICDTVFRPLDEDQDCDSEKKDKCYKSFHILAEYYESKGFSGILYSSTRMRLVGKTGSNLVLFDADCAEANQNSLRTIIV